MELPVDDFIGGLADLRQDGILCDITLQTEGGDISAHRALLASASLYFRAMFGGSFKEAKENVVDLDALGVSHVGLTAIVDCLYSLKLNITKENLVLVTEAANLLQFTSIIRLCEKFIQSHLDIQNCLQILQLCETYGMKSTKHTVDLFVLENLIAISKENPEYVEMSKDHLVRYIADTELLTKDETEVYHAVMKWIKRTPSRDEHTVELMQHIRVQHIPLDVITERLAKEPLLNGNKKCAKQVKEGIDYHNFPLKQPLFNTLPPRGELSVMAWKQEDTEGVKKSVLKSFHSPDKSIEIMGPDLSVDNCVTLGNFAFFLCSDDTEFSHIRYDPVLDKCLTLGPVPVRKEREEEDEEEEEDEYMYWHGHKEQVAGPYGLLYESLGDMILLGGGHTVMYNKNYTNFESSSTCYKYSIEHNTWAQTVDLPEALNDPVSCVHNNCLYITSYEIKNEVDWEDYRKKLWMFDPTKEVWSEKAVPLHVHAQGVFAASGDKLFLSGGHTGNYSADDTGSYTKNYQETAELYDIKSDQWSNVLDIHPNLHPSLCRIMVGPLIATDTSGNIYLVGSTDTDMHGHHKPNVAIVFNPITGVVSKYQSWDRKESQCFVVVPKGRFIC